MEDMLKKIAPVLALRGKSFILVTMATGLTIAKIQEMAGGKYSVIRIMPNTPVSIGEGMVLYWLPSSLRRTARANALPMFPVPM